jgi:AcrR family transcriptional regulator
MVARGPYARTPATRKHILDVAVSTLDDLDYPSISLREIARRAGVSQTGLRYHFATKEALYAEVLRQRDEPRATPETPEDLVETMLTGFAANRDSPQIVRLYALLSAEAATPDTAASEFFRERFAYVSERIARAISGLQETGEISTDADPKLLARILIATMDGLQMQWLVDDNVDLRVGLTTLWDLIATSSSTAGDREDAVHARRAQH